MYGEERKAKGKLKKKGMQKDEGRTQKKEEEMQKRKEGMRKENEEVGYRTR